MLCTQRLLLQYTCIFWVFWHIVLFIIILYEVSNYKTDHFSIKSKINGPSNNNIVCIKLFILLRKNGIINL